MTSTILITVAGRGLGLYLVHRYHDAGFIVLAGTRQPSVNLAKLRESSPDRLFEISLDVTSRQSVSTAARMTGMDRRLGEKLEALDTVVISE